MKFADATKYPKIFGTSYWGNFPYESKRNGDNDVFNNRNEFIETNNIVKRKKIIPKYMYKYIGWDIRSVRPQELDHFECYETSDKDLVMIASPYHVPDTFLDFYSTYGYRETKPLYGAGARTFIKIWCNESPSH